MIPLHEMSRMGKCMDTGSRLVVAGGREGAWGVPGDRYEASLSVRWNVLESDNSDDCTIL